MIFEHGNFAEALRMGLRAWNLNDLEDKILPWHTSRSLVLDANRELNLTRIVEPREMAVKNFLDSLSILMLELACPAALLGLGYWRGLSWRAPGLGSGRLGAYALGFPAQKAGLFGPSRGRTRTA